MHPRVISTPPALTALRATAVRTLNSHLNHLGWCAICCRAWPCEPVRLADTNLAAT
jgi:hypothetical protein